MLEPRLWLEVTNGTVEECAAQINEILRYNGYEVVRDGNFYKVRELAGAVIEVEHHFADSDALSELLIEEQIKKCREKVEIGDYSCVITNGSQERINRQEVDMSQHYPSPIQLWAMQPHLFNEWRANNDLPQLFEFLRDTLPGFNDWLNGLPFDMDVALRIVPTGDIFKGDKQRVVIKRDGEFPGTFVYECREGTAEEATEWWKIRHADISILGEIEPYFKWAERVLGRKRFSMWKKKNSPYSDRLLYGSWVGLNEGGCVTKANLFGDFTVLKLGQVELERGAVIGQKNLDFCDLDFLTIKAGWHGYGSSWKTINYSSCREISFVETEVAFYEFYSCAATKFTITNTKFQDLYFERTDVQELRLSNSFLFKIGIKDSSVTPFIQNCEIRELSYLPKVGAPYLESSTTYRLLRAAFQSSGLRQEASNFYYKERVYERKSYFHPQLIDRKTFQGLDYGGQISILNDLYVRGFFEKKDLPKEIRKVLVSKVKMHIIPKYLFPLMKSRFKWFISLFESILWGYGERPSRIILVALATVTFYSGIYSYFDWLDEKGNPYHLSLLDSSYFSVVTFTTLGYGDITPKTEILKLLAGSEALLGAFTMGLIVAGFSNRSRY